MFSKSKDEPSNRQPRANGSLSIIAADVVITGNVVTSGELQLDGTVEGDIKCGGVTIGESGKLHGALLADHATIRGEVKGGVRAKNLVLERTARVTGDVLHESISIEAGAQVEGRFQHTINPLEASAASPPEAPALKAVSA
jgi:cytoskeletal protein CcmA (bactofilin family)